MARGGGDRNRDHPVRETECGSERGKKKRYHKRGHRAVEVKKNQGGETEEAKIGRWEGTKTGAISNHQKFRGPRKSPKIPK